MTPAAGRYVANKFGARYDEKRLLNDQTYNVQLGTAELGDLFTYYRGSYILSFAGYNAGRGWVKDWIAKYGDPRDPKIDPIERIPFSETRNYVQRVLESLKLPKEEVAEIIRQMQSESKIVDYFIVAQE